MSKDQEVTAVRVANVPAEDFEAAVESDDPPTITAALISCGRLTFFRGCTVATMDTAPAIVTALAELGTKTQPKTVHENFREAALRVTPMQPQTARSAAIQALFHNIP
jgi:hypothetical protein